jgi:cephalosporin hydroxylase
LEAELTKLKGALNSAPELYHIWFYDTHTYEKVNFQGVTMYKSLTDLWNYQEIIFRMKPKLIVEFGTHFGGSTLFFASMLKLFSVKGKVLTVDISGHHRVAQVDRNKMIEAMNCSSADPKVAERIRKLRKKYRGNIFVILDSDHAKDHVLAELEMLRSLLIPGDYVIVEDSNINGHPVLPGWGEGPYEAIVEYEKKYPNDYINDKEQELKYGFTWAPKGYLVRQ